MTFVEVCQLYPEELLDCFESEQQDIQEIYCSLVCMKALSTLRGRKKDITTTPSFLRSIGGACEESCIEDTEHPDQLG